MLRRLRVLLSHPPEKSFCGSAANPRATVSHSRKPLAVEIPRRMIQVADSGFRPDSGPPVKLSWCFRFTAYGLRYVLRPSLWDLLASRPAMSVDKSGHRIQQMFASIADRYDLMNHLLSLQMDRYWRWWTVRQVAPDGPDPILDVCTGTGDLAIAYWKAGDGKVRVVATDFCHPMLEIGRKKKQTAGINGTLEFLEADTQSLPFSDDLFQIVSVAFGLRNVSDTWTGLREMYRVCRPGGRVVILEFSTPQRWPWRPAYQWYFRHVLPRVGQLLARNEHSAYSYLPESVNQFPDGPELAHRLAEVGLEDVRFFPLTLGIATLYVGKKPGPTVGDSVTTN